MPTVAEKAATFRALHGRPGAFVIPNPWDPGTAHLLEALGFEALATTSAGFAFSLAKRDYQVGRDATLEHAAAIVAATDLPVSADLENAFGDSPEEVAETFRLAVDTGLAGGSVEDTCRRPEAPVYDMELAADRVRAAVEVTRARPHPFTLTARADNYLARRPDLADTIRRLQAYQEAGADVLYAPGLTTREDIATLVHSVDRPVNVIMGLVGVQLSRADLEELGVKRISVGSALTRAALGAFLRAAEEMRDHGTFDFANEAVDYARITGMFGR